MHWRHYQCWRHCRGCARRASDGRAAAPEDEDPARALSKRARAAKKKVRACEDLAARARDGADLDDDQRAKLEKMAAFAAEAEALERQLAALSTGGGRDATTGAGATLARP